MTYEELQQLLSELSDKDKLGVPIEGRIEDYDKILNAYRTILEQNETLIESDLAQKSKIAELREKLKTNWLYSTKTEEQEAKSEARIELEKIKLEDI